MSNPERVVYARLPGFRLSDEGRAEAEGLAGNLAMAPVAAVYASPLDRALETAEILARHHGIEIQVDDRLSEWAFWVGWQGLPWGRIRERDPEVLERYWEDPESVGGNESLAAAGGAVLEWAEDADAARDGLGRPGLVIGVSHEAPLVAAMLVGQGIDLSGYHRHNLAHLGAVRLRPGPPEEVDLVEWARSC